VPIVVFAATAGDAVPKTGREVSASNPVVKRKSTPAPGSASKVKRVLVGLEKTIWFCAAVVAEEV